MSLTFYQLIHVVSVFVLTALTFYLFAAPARARTAALVFSCIASFVAFYGGLGLVFKFGLGWPGWVLVKIACWFVLTLLMALCYRERQWAGLLSVIATLAVIVAVLMVYLKPF